MSKAREIVPRHVAAALEEAKADQIPADSIGRIMLEKVIEIYRQERPLDDIARELIAAAEHLDPDEDFMFMRP